MTSVHTDEEWMTCYDPNTNSPYYYNTITGITQWELPEELTTLSSSHFFTPPGGIRPQHSNEEMIPNLIKIKSTSGTRFGSFRSQKKILPEIETEINPLPQGDSESEQLQDDLNPQRKSRPIIKLKGTSLLNLKRALSNQQLEIETETANDPPPHSSTSATHDNEFQENSRHVAVISSEKPPNNQSQTVNQATSSTSRDYIAMAQQYQKFLPYSSHSFDPNTKCILCSLGTPDDILFPCNHRCVCRNCLSLPPLSLQFNLTKAGKRPRLGSEKVFCPLCNSFVKQIIPVNGMGTEEKEYWDWFFMSGKNSVPSLDQNFTKHFLANTPSIVEKYSHLYTFQSDLDPLNSCRSKRGYEGGDVGEAGEQDESQKSIESEIVESFPQFSLEKDQEEFQFCCNIQ